jgi:hypothetical protein
MKQPKRLTYDCKRIVSAQGMNPDEWQIQTEDKDKYIIINKNTKETRVIDKCFG